MPTGISKRQQARNEKTLTELIRTVPGNDRCADCDALTPGTSREILIVDHTNSYLNRMGKLECMSIPLPSNESNESTN
jgi:hypothetical protein